jgi:hypothetical protein
MPIFSRKKKGDYSTAPEGLHPAVCVDVIDLGLVQTEWGEKYRVEIRWELDQIDPESEKGRPYMVTAKYTNSLHEKSRLRPMLEAWRGRKFTSEELGGFDLERLLGANCQIQVIHNITDKGTFANVQAVVPAPKNSLMLVPSKDYVRVINRPKQDEQRDEFEREITDDDIPF